MDLLAEYGLFLAETVTVVVAIVIIVGVVAANAGRQRELASGDRDSAGQADDNRVSVA